MSSASGGSGHAAASFTDLMASLMVIFVLLFVAYVNNAAAKGKTAQDELLSTLKRRLTAIGISPDAVRRDERDKNAIVVIMPDSLLFQRGSKTVGQGGETVLREIMPLLATVLCEARVRSNIQTVVVEGHTDTTWAAAGLGAVSFEAGRDSNLALSQGRSMEVVKIGLRALPEPDQRVCLRNLLSASGRGQEELLAEVPGDDARQRRVVFKIRVATDLSAELTSTVKSDAVQVRQAPKGP
jgi:outer membrane protein OmpA-like peptidoglycan-associated protein